MQQLLGMIYETSCSLCIPDIEENNIMLTKKQETSICSQRIVLLLWHYLQKLCQQRITVRKV